MKIFTGAEEPSGDLFGDILIPVRDRSIEPRCAPELIRARVLCRQLRQQRARAEKMRITHLICLNLVSMLKTDGQRG